MAQRFDVPARLAEGREAVTHTQTYVSACALRGYSHPDLTGYGAQVGEWYDGEDGLDLWLLDGDCAELRAVAEAAEEALRVQRAQLGELAAAWRGPGADTAAEFVGRHCDTGAALAAGLRRAAQACGALRDELWRLVDDKVAAAIGIDDRSAADRPVWLAAAHTVMSGDRKAADVIDHQVIPHVDNDIRGDWISAMRSARDAVTAAYDTAAAAATPGPGFFFPVPGELGPRYQPEHSALPVAPAPLTPVVAMPDPPPAPPVDPPPAWSDPVSAATAPRDDPLPPSLDDAGWPGDAGLPGGLPTGGGLPVGGGGFGGLMPRIADAIGGLLGSPDDGRTDPAFNEPFDDGPFDDELDDPDSDDDAAELADDTDEAEPDPESEQPAEEVTADEPTGGAITTAADQQTDPPQPNDPAAQAAAEEKTPCEIAADELPRVGQ